LTTSLDDLDTVHSSYRDIPSLHSPPNGTTPRSMTPAHTAVGRATITTPQPESVVPSVLHSIETAGTMERRTTCIWPRSAGVSSPHLRTAERERYHEVCVLTSLDGKPPRELSHSIDA
jgi:hypothetical protein